MRDARHPLGAEEKNSHYRGSAIPILIEKHVRQYRSPEDGTRLLVMRYWPRGVRREAVDHWLRDLAPSPGLLREFKERQADLDVQSIATGRDEHWSWFISAYRGEMSVQTPLISELRVRHECGEVITLLCVCHDLRCCHRSLLAELILGHPPVGGRAGCL